MTTESSVIGYAPKVIIGTGNAEALKYEKMWAYPQYRQVAPGETFVFSFIQQAHPQPGATIIDFGCGTGRAGLRLAVLHHLDVTLLDFARNCLDEKVRQALDGASLRMRFLKADLEHSIPAAAQYGFCCDVMEHIPPEKVDIVLNNILRSAQHVFFSIANVYDKCGALIDEELHLTVESYEWWLEKFKSRDCKVHWSQDLLGTSLFYVSGWIDGQDVVDSGVLNSGEEIVKANVKCNTAGAWQQVTPHEQNPFEAMILGGGPSLAEFEADIKQKRAEGVKCVTLNGAYNWAVHHGLRPSAQIVVDSRPFNSRFVQPIVPDCKYLIASQCDPSVFQNLPPERTYIWHTSTELITDVLNQAYDQWYAIPGGSTVLLRAIPLMRMLGYRQFHLYGCDSCFLDGEHHVYAQPENDIDLILNVVVQPGGRLFRCHPWMASQAQEFLTLIRYFGNEIELAIYGNGLLAHILNVGAQAEVETELT